MVEKFPFTVYSFCSIRHIVPDRCRPYGKADLGFSLEAHAWPRFSLPFRSRYGGLQMQQGGAHQGFFRACFRSRTPGPPLSSKNSTPADSSADRILDPVSFRPPSGPSWASSRLIVGIETSEAAASRSCDQARSARAALICLIDTFSIDFCRICCDTFSIERLGQLLLEIILCRKLPC
jgi:hypothetical protein